MGEFYGNQYTESKYSDYEYEDLVEDVRKLADELGEPPTTADAEDDDRLPYLNKIYELIEEDWSTVLADAGVESGSLQIGEYDSGDRNRMAVDLRKANDETPGQNLTMREYDDYGAFATSTVKKHFGSWRVTPRISTRGSDTVSNVVVLTGTSLIAATSWQSLAALTNWISDMKRTLGLGDSLDVRFLPACTGPAYRG